MIVVLQDDNTVSLYASVEDLVADIAALDADAIAAAYDDTAGSCALSWIRPNCYGRKSLGLQSVAPGEYRRAWTNRLTNPHSKCRYPSFRHWGVKWPRSGDPVQTPCVVGVTRL